MIPSIPKANLGFSSSAPRRKVRFSLSLTPNAARISVSSVHVARTRASAASMPRKPNESDNLRAHYDFSGGIRGKYAARYAQGTNVVVLSPDVAEVFPDSEALNEALRTLLRLSGKRARHKPTTKKR